MRGVCVSFFSLSSLSPRALLLSDRLHRMSFFFNASHKQQRKTTLAEANKINIKTIAKNIRRQHEKIKWGHHSH